MSQSSGAPMTAAQRDLVKNLAHQVTGDGNAYVASFLAARGGVATAREASAEISALKARAAAGERSQTRPAPTASPAATEAPTKSMTDAQLIYLRRLAHQVTGDGDAHIAKFLAARGGSATARDASDEIYALKARAAAGERTVTKGQHSKSRRVNAPAGRYGVRLPGSGPQLVELTKPTSGEWAGHTFLKTVPYFLGGEAEQILGEEAGQIARAIEADPRGCSSLYGTITGRCGMCNRRLKDAGSISLGIGPECVARF